MSSEDEITPFEAEMGKRLVARPHGRHLPSSDLVELAIYGTRSPRYEAGMEHIVSCKSCRGLLRQFQEMERARGGSHPVRSTRFSGSQARWAAAGSLAVVVALLLMIGRFVIAPARTVASLQDAGGTIRLTAGEELSGLPNLDPAQKTLLVAALRTGRLPTPAVLAGLRPPTGGNLQAAAFSVTGPVSTVVASPQPEFTWKMPANAVACRVLVDNLVDPQQTIKSKPIKVEHWKPKKPLTPGQSYRWQVIALDRAGKEIARVPQVIGTARFKVLEKDAAAALERAQVALGRSHLAMGVLYAHEGMLDDAEREFQALSQTNANSELVRNLIASVRAMRS
ncbi:MAG: hypothetical protein JWL77_1549 [Chthonomonadaceae bacterium]|nr:hypothetical protein [Chthonomonadaceae bacterium]